MKQASDKLNRRTFVKGSAAAVGAVAISLPGSATRVRAQGEEITVGIWDFAHEPLQPIVDEFTAQTGISVVWSANPSAGGDQVAQLSPQFASESTPVDVLSASDEAAPGFLRAGWLEPLDDLLTEAFWADFPQAMIDYVQTWSSADEQTYRIPHGWEYGYYWTRKDLLTEMGMAAPATWDDLRALGEAAKAKGMFAFGDAASQPSLAFVYAAYLGSQTGGDLFAFDDGTQQAFEFAKELIDKGYFPKDAINWTYDQSNAAYMADQLVTMRQWSFFWDVSRANTEWFAEDKVVIELPPAGPKQRGTWAGAWGWTIPAATTKMDAAKEFVKFITARERAAPLAEALSNFIMPHKAVLEAMADNPFVQIQGQYSEAGVVVGRPFHPRVSEAQSVVDAVFSGYLSGQFDIAEAMETGKRDVEALSE